MIYFRQSVTRICFGKWPLKTLTHHGIWCVPHEIYEVKGYHLEDYFGEEWKEKYAECVHDERIVKTNDDGERNHPSDHKIAG